MPESFYVRVKGKGETDTQARRRRLKVTRLAVKLSKRMGRKVSEAEIIRDAIDVYTPLME